MGDFTQLITELQIRMAAVEQAQDDINGYLDSLTTDIDIVKTNQLVLNNKIYTIENGTASIDMLGALEATVSAIDLRVATLEGTALME